MRVAAILVVLLGTACAYEPLDGGDPAGSDEPTIAPGSDDDTAALVALPTASTDAPREALAGVGPALTSDHPAAPWTFAVLSDLHLPNPRAPVIDRTVAALIAMHVRFVVVTGDFTNGAPITDKRSGRAGTWWAAVTGALAPLRDAGIPVLPIAGNHDTYLAWHRQGFEGAFGDLAQWTAPLEIHPGTGKGFARAPYSYSVDVDGVHLTLTNIVDQTVDRDVAAWLTDDLAAAAGARVRMVFGHVPLFTVIRKPPRGFVAQLGGILTRGNVDFYVAGHEHITWDETFAVGAHLLRQVTVGCASGFYVFAPSVAARARAGCEPTGGRGPLHCTMPNGGRFDLVRDRGGRMIEHDSATFTVFTVAGADVQATPMALGDDGAPRAFYLAQ